MLTTINFLCFPHSLTRLHVYQMSLERNDSTMSDAMGELLGTSPAEVDVSHVVVDDAIEKLETPKKICPDSRPTNEDLPPVIDNSDSDDEDTRSLSDGKDRPVINGDVDTENDDSKDDEDDGDGGWRAYC